mgnify:CR=1 FL=1
MTYSLSTASLLFALSLGLGGCASVCLQTPVSDKVSNDAVGRCAEEAKTSLARRDIFDRYVRLRWVRGEYEEIVKLAREVLERDGDRTDARFYLAVGLRKLGRCDEALTHYRRYADRRPSDADPHFGMALCYEGQNRRNDAVAAYQAYLKKEKRPDKVAWRNKASARLAALGSGAALAIAPRRPTAKAPVAAKAPVVAKPRPKAPVAKPAVAVAKPAPKADCSAHDAAIKKDPFDTKAYDAFARCSLARKDHAAVLRRMRIAIRDNPEWAKGWLHLGTAYQAAGKSAQAKSAFAKACSAGVPGSCGR